jgi:two-component system, cell cycle sensor histidine kinase and response regulator CckA
MPFWFAQDSLTNSDNETVGGRDRVPANREMEASVSAGRILVVDDEDAIRELARRILTREGYEVIAASGGEEALTLLADRDEQVDLLLTDVIMPRMSGKELAERFASLRAGARVLYMSGYTDRLIGLDEVDALIEKPFNRDGLLDAVGRALEPAH